MVRALCFALLMIVSGCSTSNPEPIVSAILAEKALSSATHQEFDFGSVLAHGQNLRHDFMLTNPSNDSIRVRGTRAWTPCCSALEDVPPSLPPNGEVKATAVLRVGLQTGRKRVAFEVGTDSRERPVFRLALSAQLFAEWEIQRQEGTLPRLPVGQAGVLRYQMICRRIGDSGRSLPSSVDVDAPHSVAFGGDPTKASLPGGIVETSSGINVKLAGMKDIGLHRERLRFRWRDGRTEEMPLAWEVVPAVRLVPSVLVLPPSPKPSTYVVVIRSEDRPIRITDVSGPLLAEPVTLPLTPERTHTVRLVLKDLDVALGKSTEVRILTDHPQQPVVPLGIVVLPKDTMAGGEP
jgi:hypothetical protein